jgi:thiol-disulfide isomerase/thioredoxin
MSVYKQVHVKKNIEKGTSVLPSFTFTTLKNEAFYTKNLFSAKDKIIFNYFNPDCEHCQSMANSYLQNADKLKAVKIIMLTLADSTVTAKFASLYKLNTIPSIIVLRDTKFQFEKAYGHMIVPSFFVYKENKLVKKIIGEAKIEYLLSD